MGQPQKTVDVVVGGWFGDEGKGKIISYVVIIDSYENAGKGGVGTNAGHTVCIGGRKYQLSMVPSAFTNPNTKLYIGRGVLVDPKILLKEIELCEIGGRFYVDRLCPIIDQEHIDRDRTNYNKSKLGTTGTGSGIAQQDRVTRSDKLRFAKDVPELSKYVADVSSCLIDGMSRGEKVLVEMTQGAMLSLFGFETSQGLTYPQVTTKDTTAGSACADVGIGPTHVKDVIVVYKALPSRVGTGVFPGELPEESQQKLRAEGKGEYGTVTGRMRRLGEWTPEVFRLAKKTADMNGATQIAVTKIDMVYDGNKGERDYRGLTGDARSFIEKLENELDLPVTLIGTGEDVFDIVDRR
ncbi:MAG: adenylosuccinate synthetase [Candidatus Aenigmarchaeota archaeon]|nr:adenylosuccinate synthetase [Candidatus Aenigmarchaeota archaeon]